MGPFAIMIAGVIELALGALWLGLLIRKPPTDQPPRVLIGRVLIPVSALFMGVSMVMQPSTAQTAIPSLVAVILTIIALFLQIRYRPTKA